MVLAAAVVILFLAYLSSSGKKPPRIPKDAQHARLATSESCSTCHAPGKASPLKENHPPKEQCLVCHER
jgi:hypothetical protein